MHNNNKIVIEANYIAPVEQKTAGAIRSVGTTRLMIRQKQAEIRAILVQDEDYNELKKEMKRLNAELKVKKLNLMEKPQISEIQDKIDSLKENLKTEQLTLFTYLDEYIPETKKDFIEVDGERKMIEKKYLVKKYKI